MTVIKTREVDEFITWADAQERKRRDIEAVLRDRVEERRDDLFSEDDGTRKDAAEEISEILDHLSGPPPPLSREARQILVKEAIKGEDLPAAERNKTRKRIMRATGKSRGRPRNETSQQAIQAYTLRLVDEKWDAIASTLRRCNHLCADCGADYQTRVKLEAGRAPAMKKARLRLHIQDRKPLRSWEQRCSKCGSVPPRSTKAACLACTDAIRAAVKRLNVLLRRIGYDVPQTKRTGTN